jgi:hypothetical protein
VDLATQLGMARPTNIRKFIETHRDELESFGQVARTECSLPMPGGRGFKTGTEYHLNRNQALLTCILSQTPAGREIRAEVIRRFDAYEGMVEVVRAVTDPRRRKGQAVASPDPFNPPLTEARKAR